MMGWPEGARQGRQCATNLLSLCQLLRFSPRVDVRAAPLRCMAHGTGQIAEGDMRRRSLPFSFYSIH
ncbi:unnamed protein product [Urochloa humidicola]